MGDSVRPHIIASNLEHDSIKLVLEHFQKQGKAGEHNFFPSRVNLLTFYLLFMISLFEILLKFNFF